MKQFNVVKLVLKNRNETFEIEVDALATPLICSSLQGQEVKLAKETFPHLFNLELADEFPKAEAHVDILIGTGADVMWQFMSGDTRWGESPNSPIATATKLGWVLSGPMAEIPKSKMSGVNLNATHVSLVANSGIPAQADEVLQNQVNRSWELESIGIVDKKSESVHDKFKRSLIFENGWYTAKLPFKEQHSILPDNFKLSATRLYNQLKHLKQQPHILKEYNKIITDQLESGIIEELNPLMDCPEPGKVHYLPHHPVIREQAETTKIRVVYDASAKLRTDMPLLINIGPPLIPTIFDILLRFRWNRIAVTADIKSAFMMINTAEHDKDFLRFLWVDDINSDDPSLVFHRFSRVVFRLCSSPFLLNGTLHYHLRNYFLENPELLKILLKSFYVDDFVSGIDTKPETFDLCLQIKECLAQAGFSLYINGPVLTLR